MDSSALDYDLPAELIAQKPAEPRDSSRLLVYERASGEVRHRRFRELPDELTRGELVVVNDSRVIPARLRLRRPGGGAAEVLLLEPAGDGVWEALARPSAKLRAGMRLGPVELVEPLGAGRWLVRLDGEPDGETPLPPYITEPLEDPERYQTVYARDPGSAAAPTAGLHFTPERAGPARRRACDAARRPRHLPSADRADGRGAPAPRRALRSRARRVGADPLRRSRCSPQGRPSVRVVESLARGEPIEGRTELFVTPGFEFRRVDALLTNFHLPRTTLLALVMAFAGVDETRELYRLAIAERYRFYSFGDAMLVL